ncbi:TetR/AcrR family transcriptional regulator [Jiangella mangrovi]|uniref:AcrR family transcriptional regulator n=1 Tax=Jiangella mangrovi TaxID=1524084 RepID=A0A7W9LL33_9ACTN|nr:TetR/AcrR family transcriptional regulator [Jiangella mangrovi]MBB5787677.1 AcrR family transcriptional regulator [Jiangella mangrovi]
MPKVVDHEQRRREIVDAVLRVVVRDGAAGASVRTVAAEAGWSTGALRHYFATQRELREFTARMVTERVGARIRAYVGEHEFALPLPELAAGILEQLIPLDEQRREEYQLWLAIGEWSRTDHVEESARMWAEQRDIYLQIVYRLSGYPNEPVPADGLDPRVAAWAEYLHVFVDGLAAQAMFVPADMPPDRVRAVLRAFLAEVPSLADRSRSASDGGA